jgi:hypothetical protein
VALSFDFHHYEMTTTFNLILNNVIMFVEAIIDKVKLTCNKLFLSSKSASQMLLGKTRTKQFSDLKWTRPSASTGNARGEDTMSGRI